MAQTRQDHWTTRPIIRGLSAFQLSLAFFAVVVGALILAAALGGGKSHHYAVSVSGSAPQIQTVGQGIEMPVNISNRGSAIPDLVLDVAGCADHWVLDGVTVSGGAVSPASGSYYEFGQLSRGGVDNAVLQVTPRDAGNHTCQVKVWVGPMSSGVPQGGELETVTSTVAINP